MTVIPNQAAELRLQNARRVLLATLYRWPCTKPELAQRTGLTQMTVGKVVDQLLGSGLLIRASESAAGGQGRPPLRVIPNQAAGLVGIELGVRETAIYRFGLAGEPEPAVRRTLPAHSSLPTLRAAWNEFRRELPPAPVQAVVIAVPGVLDTQVPSILYSANLHWTEGAELLAALATDFAAPVCPVHEAQAVALGHLNTREASEHFLLVELGDGIGSTVVNGGRLLGGPLPLSGEIGHTVVPGNARRCGCGAVGCVETLAGRGGLLASYRQHAGRADAEWSDLCAALEQGGLPPWLQETLEALSIVVAGALNLLGYREVVFVGALTGLHTQVMPCVEDALMRHSLLGRFGRIECRAAPVRRQLGMLAAAVERFYLPAHPVPASAKKPKASMLDHGASAVPRKGASARFRT